MNSRHLTSKKTVKETFGRFAGKRVQAHDIFKPGFSHLPGNHAVVNTECPVLKDLFETAKKLGLSVRLSPLCADVIYTNYNYKRLQVELERKGTDHWVISNKIKIG